MGCAIVNTYKMFGHTIDVMGCYDSKKPLKDYEFFDFYIDDDDDPINLGNPYYTQTGSYPTKSEVKAFLTKYLSIN